MCEDMECFLEYLRTMGSTILSMPTATYFIQHMVAMPSALKLLHGDVGSASVEFGYPHYHLLIVLVLFSGVNEYMCQRKGE